MLYFYYLFNKAWKSLGTTRYIPYIYIIYKDRDMRRPVKPESAANVYCAKLKVDLVENGLEYVVDAYTEYDVEAGCHYIVGRYRYSADGVMNTGIWEAKLDMHFSDGAYDIFLAYFVNRKAFLMANYYWQEQAAENNIHPQAFKVWFDGKKVKASEMWKSNKELV